MKRTKLWTPLKSKTRRTIAGSLLILATAMLAAASLDNTAVAPLRPGADVDYTAHHEGTNLWFVELKSPPAIKGTSEARLKAEKQAFRDAAANAGVSFNERYAFDKLWNGFSMQVDRSHLSTLTRLPGVKGVYPVVTMKVPDTQPNLSPDMATAIAMTGADLAQSAFGTGTGIKVGVMDTGIDYDHADLGGDGIPRSNSGAFPNSRVTAGWDFVGDNYNAASSSPSYQPVPHPDAFPDDCNGHGSHVAGIVGASGNTLAGGVRGVAPGVTFGAYRVFGCDGSTDADIMVMAMERAYDDGMHVLNMSIGSAFMTWPQYPTASVASTLVEQGMVVVTSIGNSGASGLYSASAPGVGTKVIGTASVDNSHVKLRTFTVTPAGLTAGYTNATAAPAAPTSGSLALAKTGTPAATNDGCNAVAPAPGSLTGKAVLIRRGTCSFYEKSRNAQLAGASAVVLYNNVAGRINPTVALDPAAGAPQDPIGIPVVAISDTEGVAINNAIDSGSQTLNWTNDEGTFANATGGLISSFSSYGLAAELDVKPDISAPGGLIRSTYPLENGGYATISGTSMASPHTAGAVALMLQAKGWTTRSGAQAESIRGLLQNTAVPGPWQGNPGLGFLDMVHRQGAGLLKIDKAIAAPVSVSPGKLVQGEAGPDATHTLTLTNISGSAITYDTSHQPALSTTGSTFAPGANTAGAANGGAIVFTPPTVVVPAGGTASVIVTIPRPNFGPANRLVYGGYLRFTPQGGGQMLSVPYAGLGMDYQAIQILTSGGAAVPYPKLARWEGWVEVAGPAIVQTYSFPANPVTYTMEKAQQLGRKYADIPVIAAHFDHQARWAKLTVLDAAGNPVVSNTSSQMLDPVAMTVDLMPRNSTAGGFFTFEWDGRLITTLKNGKTSSKNMPNGDYKLRLEVLKPLGIAPADVEIYTSPTFTIARPN